MTPQQTESPAAGSSPAAGPFWSRRWGWPHALAVVGGCSGAATCAQLLYPGSQFTLPAGLSWPVTAAWCVSWLVAGLVFSSRVLVRGIGGRHLGMTALSSVALLSLPAAVFGWRGSLTGLPMAVACACVLANLSTCVGRRLTASGRGGFPILLTHLGLLLAFAAMVAGRPRVERGTLRLTEAGPAAESFAAASGSATVLPFSVRLLDFRMERYEPNLALAKRDTVNLDWSVVPAGGRLVPGRHDRIGQYRVRVEEYIPSARIDSGRAVPCDSAGAAPAVRVAVTDSYGQPVADGWLHNASPFGQDILLRLATGTVLFLNPGKPRQFESVLELGHSDRAETLTVAVNRPARRLGWTLMQSGYDSEAGASSRLSIIEVSRDGSLPFIYTGIALVLAGVISLTLAAGRTRGRCE